MDANFLKQEIESDYESSYENYSILSFRHSSNSNSSLETP